MAENAYILYYCVIDIFDAFRNGHLSNFAMQVTYRNHPSNQKSRTGFHPVIMPSIAAQCILCINQFLLVFFVGYLFANVLNQFLQKGLWIGFSGGTCHRCYFKSLIPENRSRCKVVYVVSDTVKNQIKLILPDDFMHILFQHFCSGFSYFLILTTSSYYCCFCISCNLFSGYFLNQICLPSRSWAPCLAYSFLLIFLAQQDNKMYKKL